MLAFKCRLASCGSDSWNETRTPGIHHVVEPLTGLNAIDFIKRVLWNGTDIAEKRSCGRLREYDPPEWRTTLSGGPSDRTSFAQSAAHLFLSRPWIKPEAASEHNWTKVSPTLWSIRLCAFL